MQMLRACSLLTPAPRLRCPPLYPFCGYMWQIISIFSVLTSYSCKSVRKIPAHPKLTKPHPITNTLLCLHRCSSVSPLIASAVFYAANGSTHVPFIDALFICFSATTVCGLVTVDLSSLTGFQQAILFVLTSLGHHARLPPTLDVNYA